MSGRLSSYQNLVRRPTHIGWYVALLGVLIFFIGAGTFGAHVFLTARALQHTVTRIQDEVIHDVEHAQRDSAHALVLIGTLRRDLVVFRPLGDAPVVGSNIRAAEKMLDAADHTIRAISGLVHVAAKIRIGTASVTTSQGLNTIGSSEREHILRTLFEAEPIIAGSRANSALALHELERIDTHLLIPPLEKVYRSFLEKEKMLYATLDQATPFLSALPYFAGYPDTRTYLFLLQNNTEVRATGGFIGTYGILRMHQGDVVSFKTDNIYNLDDHATGLHVTPPMPFQKYFPNSITRWYLRDSNWSPDFRDAARQAEWFYTHEGGKEKIDGVFAITPDVVTSLLQFVGPIELDGIVFTADTFVSQLEYHVEKGYVDKGIPEHQRKEIVGRLGHIILERVRSLEVGQLRSLFGVVLNKLDEKHILLYSNADAYQAFLETHQWAGRIENPPGDFLMVVDSNLASLKTDMVMDKQISYDVWPEGDDLHGRVMVTYRNNGTFSWNTTRYRDWVRVYIPDGSSVVSSQGAMVKELSEENGTLEISHEHGKMGIGAYIVVEPQRTKTFTVEYILPSRLSRAFVRDHMYTLFVQKQSGITGQEFIANLSFPAPVVSFSPRGFANGKTGEGSVAFQSDLRVDQAFEVRLK